MTFIRSVLGGLAAALVATSAHAGTLEIVYWGPGTLEWVRIDGDGYDVEDGSVGVNKVPEGSYYMEFGANGQTRSVTLHLNSANYAKSGDWCIDLDLDEHTYLDEEACEEMWDAYWFGF